MKSEEEKEKKDAAENEIATSEKEKEVGAGTGEGGAKEYEPLTWSAVEMQNIRARTEELMRQYVFNEDGESDEDDFGEELGLWENERSVEEVKEEVEAEREREKQIIEGLARCPVCGEKAEAVSFGKFGEGVWVGCNRSAECSRNIEYHEEGWSLEEAAEEWNRRNRGIRLGIRKAKMWWEKRFGERARMLKKVAKESEERKKKFELERVEKFKMLEEDFKKQDEEIKAGIEARRKAELEEAKKMRAEMEKSLGI